MGNRFLPRAQVHAWSEHIGDNPGMHHTSIQRLLKDQRRLTRFIEENREQMKPNTAGVAIYICGVIIRIFDLAGGRLYSATWEQVREAQQKVSAWLPSLLPLDDGLVERFRAIEDRAQPHLLDETAMAMLQSERSEAEIDVDRAEAFKIFMLSCVVAEVLDKNWHPPTSFVGEESYSYFHIEPRKSPPKAEDEGGAQETSEA